MYTVHTQLLIGLPDNFRAQSLRDARRSQMNTLIFTSCRSCIAGRIGEAKQIRSRRRARGVGELGSNVYVFPEAKPRNVTVWLKGTDDGRTLGVSSRCGSWKDSGQASEVREQR
jgi:hypothetical protein